MGRLDVTLLRYLTADDFRILTAVEMGMKNHELVPGSLVTSIGHLRGGGTSKILHSLCRYRLLAYERGKRFDGYRLTNLGYDYLALNALRCRSSIDMVGTQIGVGKESDVFVAVGGEDKSRCVLKVHRLGRTCFRNINNKRDYHERGRKLHSWLYASRLAALREISFLKVLHQRGLPVPKPIDCNRHCVVMELIEGTLLNNIDPEAVENAECLFDQLINLVLSLANNFGLVHGDFNEFNLMLNIETGKVILIDFPQMVPVTHRYAQEYFDRDIAGIVDFFRRKFHFEPPSDIPTFEKDVIIEETADSIEVNKVVMTLEDYEKAENEEDDDVEEKETFEQFDGEKTINATDSNTPEAGEAELSALKSSDVHRDQDDDVTSVDGRLSNFGGISISSRSTVVAPEEVRSRLRQQTSKQKNKAQMKQAMKNIKGEDCAVTRKRKEALHSIRDDLKIHSLGEL